MLCWLRTGCRFACLWVIYLKISHDIINFLSHAYKICVPWQFQKPSAQSTVSDWRLTLIIYNLNISDHFWRLLDTKLKIPILYQIHFKLSLPFLLPIHRPTLRNCQEYGLWYIAVYLMPSSVSLNNNYCVGQKLNMLYSQPYFVEPLNINN